MILTKYVCITTLRKSRGRVRTVQDKVSNVKWIVNKTDVPFIQSTSIVSWFHSLYSYSVKNSSLRFLTIDQSQKPHTKHIATLNLVVCILLRVQADQVPVNLNKMVNNY
jgi:hypothetical protein